MVDGQQTIFRLVDMTSLDSKDSDQRLINRHPLEVVGITLISFGAFMLWSFQSMAAGFPEYGGSDDSFISLIVVELVMGCIAIAVLKFREYPIESLVPPREWRFLAYGALLYLVAAVISAIPDYAFGSLTTHAEVADRVFSGIKVSFLTIIGVSIVNGIYEEVFLLGYLQRTFTRSGAAVAIGMSVLVRALCHTYQGPSGVVGVCLFGLVLGIYYWKTRDLTSCIVAHMLADFVGLSWHT